VRVFTSLPLFILIAACSHPEARKAAPEVTPEKGWHVVDFGSFTVSAPRNMRKGPPLHAIDQFAGQMNSQNLDIHFTMGLTRRPPFAELAPEIKRNLTSLPGFSLETTNIHGHPAEIWSHQPPDPESVAAEHPGSKTNYLSLVVWGLPGHEVLLMDAACRHTEQYLLARRIFRSIRFAPHPERP
jgi:hypothetical protein